MFNLLLGFLILFSLSISSTYAASDPRLSPNNKFGINTLSPEAEIDDVQKLVNSNGDWGYMVITIKRSERDLIRWQAFLDDARERHLIPIFRLATDFDSNGRWQKPTENDAREWADFFSKLYFPTENRYIQVYNEVNRAEEWGGEVDPHSYAKELEKTIRYFKEKSDDFFILNAPLDLALADSRNSISAERYFSSMNESSPGIFEKLDGWASHSYPNPDFSSPPEKLGRTGIDGYKWELSEIKKYLDKGLPVFITETGWKRDENNAFLTEDQISQYYERAFRSAWSDENVVVVAPFVLGYPESLFHQFSFKKSDSEYYKYFFAYQNILKTRGAPGIKTQISNTTVQAPANILADTSREIVIRFRNTGNNVLNFRKNLDIIISSENIYAYEVHWNQEEYFPGDDTMAVVKIKSNRQGVKPATIQIVGNGLVLDEKEVIIKSDNSFTLFIQKLQNLAAYATS